MAGSQRIWLALTAVTALGCGRGDEARPVAKDAAVAAAPLPRPSPSPDYSMPKVDQGGNEEPELPYVDCPSADDADGALDAAGKAYEAGDFARAFACADVAADLIPQAVEAQHVRAAALAALGRHSQAQVGFAMALALDPDDPETLAAAADFYINILPPKHRDHVLVGLEFARRGSQRAATRRRPDAALQGRLLLLEAEAYNDLGRADIALPRVDEALALSPEFIEAQYERGVSLFNLCRFRDAEASFLAVLRSSPNDAYAHHHLGLIYERLGRDTDSESHLARARQLAPTEFWVPVSVTGEQFDAEVRRAIDEQPADVKKLLAEVSLELVDMPAVEDLTAVEPPFAPTIMGLFRGLPIGVDPESPPTRSDDLRSRRPVDSLVHKPVSADVPPRAIVLYRRNLARATRTRPELNQQIRRTLLHEIGHLRGMDEDELRRRGLE